MARTHDCPKCGGTMVEGFVLDHTYTYGAYAVANWVEGTPEKSVWLGLKLGGKTKIEIHTFRCRKCGFLESYAPG